MVLPRCYAVSGTARSATELAYGCVLCALHSAVTLADMLSEPIRLRACSAPCGTELAYGATRVLVGSETARVAERPGTAI
eukprot:842473-Rhodomonas_salina.1